MPIIQPISDLQNYSSVLDNVTTGTPVYLTKNGRGCYTIMDMQEPQQEKAQEYDCRNTPNVTAAQGITNGILEAAKKLSSFPESGLKLIFPRSEQGLPLCVKHKKYLAFYHLSGMNVSLTESYMASRIMKDSYP